MAKKRFELNRKDYLNIKKMDHHQMSLWAGICARIRYQLD